MSFAKLEEIQCPCGEVFEAELWNAINAAEEPELKETLLCGEINVVCCPACGQIFYAEHFILYHDSPNEIIAFIYPKSFASQKTHWAAKMRKDFEAAIADLSEEKIDYEPMLFFGLDEFTEIARAEEADADEVCILEYCAKDLGLELIRLKPSLARDLQLPKVLPKIKQKNGDLREEILAGLDRLLKHNEHLSSYNRIRHLIEHNKNWHLDKKYIRQS